MFGVERLEKFGTLYQNTTAYAHSLAVSCVLSVESEGSGARKISFWTKLCSLDWFGLFWPVSGIFSFLVDIK